MKYKYTGSGAIPGIPARDLTQDEMDYYAKRLYYSQKQLLESGVYTLEEEKADKQPAKKDGK